MKIEFAQYCIAKLQRLALILNRQLKSFLNFSVFGGNLFFFEAIDPLTEAQLSTPLSLTNGFASGPVYVGGSNSKYTEAKMGSLRRSAKKHYGPLISVALMLFCTNGMALANDKPSSTLASTNTNKSLSTNQSGQAAVRIIAANEELSRFNFTASGLPSGLSIHPQSGVISGTFDREANRNNGAPFIVRVNMDLGNGASGFTNIKLQIDNRPPVATDDILGLSRNPQPLNVLANDTDPNGDRLELTSATAMHGVVEFAASGLITYAPNSDRVGADTIAYQISDGHGGVANGKVEVIIE